MALLEIESPDGTLLGVERIGSGPPLLAVHGGTADRSRWAPLAPALAERFTLHLLDRRGRGDSLRESDAPYRLAAEAEDVVAVIEHVGEPVLYLGHSYGALIGMEAMLLAGEGIARAVLYEPPFDTPGHVIVPQGFVDAYAARIASGDREGALESFYREVLNIDPTPMKALPVWQARLAAAHTLEREGRIGLDYTCDPERFAALRTPVQILMGEKSPPPFPAAARAAHAAMPGSELVELPGHGHTMMDADPEGFLEHVFEFLGAGRAARAG